MIARYRLALVREPSTHPIGQRISAPCAMAMISRGILASEPQEVVICLHLDGGNRLRGYQEVSRGAIDKAQVDLRVLFAGVLVAGSPAFALAHNHPSGDHTPSPEDISLTRLISQAADLLGVKFVDHLIVSDGGWSSLRQDGDLGLFRKNQVSETKKRTCHLRGGSDGEMQDVWQADTCP